ncbi:MAG: T9SS type A sorting domain-containing protein [Bacteroidetes bacterium]|nr:MAG: T9SS type A sorting domain-containing protein [Bacteroidota bacterium]
MQSSFNQLLMHNPSKGPTMPKPNNALSVQLATVMSLISQLHNPSRTVHTGKSCHSYLFLMMFLLSAFILPQSQAQVTEAFNAIYSANIEGNIFIVGNTNVTCSPSGSCTTAQNGGAAQNNGFNSVYVNVDGLSSPANSSTANFTKPANGSVVFAALFWGGVSSSSSRNQVSFKTPAAGYQTVTGTVVSSSYGYQSYADVTSLVQAGGTGTYGVGKIQLSVGSTNQFGGWSLAIVIRDTTDLFRNLRVYKGFAQISSGNPVTLSISGFKTPPAGPVNTYFGFVAYDGDKSSGSDIYRGDSLRMNTSAGAFYLSDALNPNNDVFNSTISRLGSHITAKNPNYVNQLGLDIDVIDISNSIPNGDTSITLRLSTGGETYIPGVITTAIELYSPVMTALKLANDINGEYLEPSDTIEYTVQIDNSGFDSATELVLYDTIPQYADYVPGTLAITSGYNVGAKTDNTGDDQAEYDAIGDRLVIRLSNGANAALGGTMAPSETTTVTFRMIVEPTALDSTLITNTVRLSYKSLQFGNAFARAGIPSLVRVLHPADITLGVTTTNPTPQKSHLDTIYVTAGNTGSYDADSVRVSVPFPPNLLYYSSSQTQGTFNSATYIWNVGPIPAFGTQTLTLIVRDTNLTPLTLTGTATLLDTDKTDPILTNNVDSVTISPIPDIVDPLFINLDFPVNGDTTGPNTTVSGTTEEDIFVEVLINGIPVDTVASDNAGNWSLAIGPLATGTYTAQGRAIDRVGNTKLSTVHTFYVDATPPAVLIQTPPDNSHTNDNTPLIQGTAEVGSTLVLLLDGVPVDTFLIGPGGTWSFTPTTPLNDGPHSVTAIAQDAYGNTASDTNPFTVDTVLPTIFVDTPPEGSTTNDNTPLYVGRTEPLFTVIVRVDGTPIDTVQADANGNWSTTQPTPLSNGSHTVTGTTTDAAGNTATDSNPFTVNTSAPTVDVVTPANGSVTSDNTPAINGTTDPNLTVIVSMDGVPIDTVVANGSGNWSTNQPTPLSDGVHTVSALASDSNGNTATDANVFRVITSLPTIVINNPADGSITNDNTPPYVGTTQAYNTVIVKIDGTPIDTLVADVNGNWATNQPTPLSNGAHAVTAIAIDGLGQTATDVNNFTINTSVPSVDVVTPANGSTINDNTPVLAGTTDPNLTVIVSMDGTPIDTVIADQYGAWSTIKPSALSDGQHTVSAKAIDALGQFAIDANIFYIDTTPPAITITTPADGSTINDNTPLIYGVTEPFLRVVVRMDGTPIDTVTSDGAGNWSTTQPTPLADGAHAVSATATDDAGNSATDTNNFTIDTVPPSINVVTPANGSTTADRTPSITGTTDPNMTVIVKMDGTPIDTVVSDGSGNWSTVQPTNLSDGPHTVTGTVTDAAGNSTTDANTFTVDATAPPIDVVTPAVGSTTNDNTPTLSGTTDPNTTVIVLMDGVPIDTVVSNGSGNWSTVQPTPLSDGQHTVTGIAVDAAGNTATDSNPFIVDTLPPTIFVDTPPDGSTTSDNTPLYTGRTEPLLTVTVSVDGTPLGTAVADANGNWSFLQPFPLSNGAHTITGTVTDPAGNTASDTNPFTVNTSAPVVDVVTPANGSSITDNTPTITGTTNPNLTVIVSIDGVSLDTVTANGAGNWTAQVVSALSNGLHTASALATDSLGQTATDANVFTIITSVPVVEILNPYDGSVTNDNTPLYVGTTNPYLPVIVKIDGTPIDTVTADVNGNWSTPQLTPLSNGVHIVTAIATDALGQTATDANAFTINTSAPNVDVVTPANNSTITDNTPVINGTTDPYLTVILRVDGTPIDTMVADGLGNWSTVQPTPLSNGRHVAQATATDGLGQTAVDANIFYIDTSAPTITITTPTDGSTTNDNTPPIYGVTEPYLPVIVKIDGVPIDTVTSDGAGNWSTNAPTTLMDGPHTVTADTRDDAGNTATDTNTFTVDTTPPAVDIVTPAHLSVISSTTPTYIGTTNPNLPVRVTVDGVVIGTVTANGSGNWSIPQPTNLAEGAHIVHALATDPAGNTATDQHTFFIDTTPPVIDVVTPAVSSVVIDNTPTYTGTTEPNLTVIVKVDGVPIDTVVADGSGNWTATQPTPLSDGPHTVTGTAIDAYGRTATDTNPFTIDTIPPFIIITSPLDSTTTTNQTPTICGTTESGSAVTVRIDGTLIGSTTASGTGAWCIPVSTPLPEGPHNVVANATDPGGNPSADSITYIVDLTPPSIAIILPANGDTTGPRPTITGSTEPNITVIVMVDGTPIDTVQSDASGNWSTVQPTPLATGNHTAQGKAIDGAGNNVTSLVHTFYVDATPPAITITTPPDNSITNDNTPTYTGTTEPYLTVVVKVDGVPIDTVVADGSGNWTTTQPTPLTDGPHTVSATATDPYGNEATESNPFTVDTTPPVAVITGPTEGETTNDNTPPITGTGTPGAELVLYIDGVPVDTLTIPANGQWSYTPPTPLADGPHTTQAIVTDPAGNTYTTPVRNFTIDATPPVVTVDEPINGSSTPDNTPQICGTTEPGDSVRVVIDNRTILNTVADGSGNWCVTPPVLGDGGHTITVVAKDSVGNTTTLTGKTFTVNTKPVLSNLGTTFRYLCDGDSVLTVTGHNFNPTSVIRLNGTALTTTYVDSTTLTAPVLASYFPTPGTYTITVYTPAPGGGTSASKSIVVSGANTYISGTVYYDRNVSGSKETSEPGISAWTVSLTGTNPAYNQTTTTEPGGVYTFTNLLPDNYAVTVSPATGWDPTVPGTGSSNQTVTCGSATTGVNFGFMLSDAGSDTGSYRTFTPEALMVGTPVKKRCHLLRWYFTFTNNTGRQATGLYVEFNNVITTFYEYVPFAYYEDLGKRTQDYIFGGATIEDGEAMQIVGLSKTFPCEIRVNKWWWLYNDSSISKAYSEGPLRADSILRFLPMPNAANIRDEVFRSVFTPQGGMLVGAKVPSNSRNFAWVLMKTSKDLYNSLVDRTGTHTGRPRGFARDAAKTSVLRGALRSLPPKKHNNKLFADLATLRFNVAASTVGITPVGFGELIYDDGANPFSGLMIKTIAGRADTSMTFWQGKSQDYYIALDTAVQKLNRSFEGPIDTISWAIQLSLTGVKPLSAVSYLRPNPGAAVTQIARDANPDLNADVPESFSVYQNYPNPFNPTTTISFYLPAASATTIKIYDLLGKEVMTILDRQDLEYGEQSFTFDGANLPSGVYFFRISATVLPDEESEFSGQTFVETKKMMLIK